MIIVSKSHETASWAPNNTQSWLLVLNWKVGKYHSLIASICCVSAGKAVFVSDWDFTLSSAWVECHADVSSAQGWGARDRSGLLAAKQETCNLSGFGHALLNPRHGGTQSSAIFIHINPIQSFWREHQTTLPERKQIMQTLCIGTHTRKTQENKENSS